MTDRTTTVLDVTAHGPARELPPYGRIDPMPVVAGAER
jgi:hypothetical protein